MATIAKIRKKDQKQPISQGDIFKKVKFNYIDSEDNDNLRIVEFEFPYAIIISQACDVIPAATIFEAKTGKPTKFMPSILMCPIYDENLAKSGSHLEEVFSKLDLVIKPENIFGKEDIKVFEKDWHYRFHSLNVNDGTTPIISGTIIDFKHYFCVPASYLVNHKENRIFSVEDVFAEQITLKFSNYLSRVAIPD